MLGIVLTNLLKKRDKEFKLFANYTIKNYPYICMKDANAFKIASKGVIIIDEAHEVADSRDFKEKRNKDFSHFMFQTRKKDLIIIYATQSVDQIDKRIRNNAEWLFVCQKNREAGKIDIIMIKKNWLGEYEKKGTMIYNDYTRSYKYYNHKDIIYPLNF